MTWAIEHQKMQQQLKPLSAITRMRRTEWAAPFWGFGALVHSAISRSCVLDQNELSGRRLFALGGATGFLVRVRSVGERLDVPVLTV